MEGTDTGVKGRSDVDGSARAHTGRRAGPPETGADMEHAARATEVQHGQTKGSGATQATSGGAAARDSQHEPADRPHGEEQRSSTVDSTGAGRRGAWEAYGVQPAEVVNVLMEWAVHGDGQQEDKEQRSNLSSN